MARRKVLLQLDDDLVKRLDRVAEGLGTSRPEVLIGAEEGLQSLV